MTEDAPEQTRDDTDEGWGEAPYDPRSRDGLRGDGGADGAHGDDRDRWLLEERPPHHDRP